MTIDIIGTQTNNHSRKLSCTEDFIAKAKIKHGERHNYSFVEYTKNKESVVIECFIK